ncbi:hypothetical protein ACS0TY_019294 [Phlomoides rotata]
MATFNNLERRGANFNPTEKICKLCKEEEENIMHLFFNCKVAGQIWNQILSWLGIQIALHEAPLIHFSQFGECLGEEKGQK